MKSARTLHQANGLQYEERQSRQKLKGPRKGMAGPKTLKSLQGFRTLGMLLIRLPMLLEHLGHPLKRPLLLLMPQNASHRNTICLLRKWTELEKLTRHIGF